MAPVLDDIAAEVALQRDVAPARDTAEHVREEIVVPRAAISAHDGRKRVLLLVIALRNDAPLHGVAVHGPGSGECFGIAPTARAMVNDEVLAVTDAEAIAPDLTGVVAGAKAQKTENHIVRLCEIESVAAALALLDANAVAGSGLAGDSEVRFADHQALRLDYAADAEDHRARPLGLDGLSQAAGSGVAEIGYDENFPAASAPGISPIAFRAGECQGAAPNGGLLRIHQAVELPIGGFDNGPIELKALRLAAGHIRNHSSIGSRNAGAG